MTSNQPADTRSPRYRAATPLPLERVPAGRARDNHALSGGGRQSSGLNRIRLWLPVLAALWLLIPGAAWGKTNYKKWLNQEVVWIISKAERESFEALNSDEARDEFIEKFWSRRDPTPSSERNEYRDEHYRRFIFASKMYQEGTPGWKTDRGHVYILHGPPDAEYFFNSKSVLSPTRALPSTAQSPNTIVWVYHQNRNAKFYKGEIRVVFQPSTGLSRQNFALSDSKTAQDRADELSRHFFPAANTNSLEGDVRYQLVMAGPPRIINSKGADLPAAGMGELSRYVDDLMRSPGDVLDEQDTLEAERSRALSELRNATTAQVFFGDLTFELSTQSYYRPSGNWLLSFDVTIPPTLEGKEFQVYAVLLQEQDNAIFDEFIDTVWREEVEEGGRLLPLRYRNSFSAPSGKFRLRVALRETGQGPTGYREQLFELEPTASGKLRVGTVMLTNRVEVLPETVSEEGIPAPLDEHSVVFQSVRLLPSSSDTFAVGSLLFLFVQVWVTSPESTITMNANFIRDGQIAGRLQPRVIETAGQIFASHGTIVPLTDLEAGDYTLQLQLVDHKTKTFEIRRLPVTLVQPLAQQ